MKLTLNARDIQSISIFQDMTGSSVIDCIEDEENIFFIVAKGQYGLTVGKGGIKIKNAEKKFKKNIRIFEYYDDAKSFLQNMFKEVQNIEIVDKKILIKVKPHDRAKIIGKSGRNIHLATRMVQRLYGMEEVRVK